MYRLLQNGLMIFVDTFRLLFHMSCHTVLSRLIVINLSLRRLIAHKKQPLVQVLKRF